MVVAWLSVPLQTQLLLETYWFLYPDKDGKVLEEKLSLLTLNAAIASKVVCVSRLLKGLRILYGKQCGPRSDCSMLFASILNLSVMLGNYLQQTTSADNIFRCIFSWRFKSSHVEYIYAGSVESH